MQSARSHLDDDLVTSTVLFVSNLLRTMSSSSLTSTASPTLYNLDNFLRFCNPNDGLQVQLMIKAGSDSFASLIGDLCSQSGHISMLIS
ncbi:unnamed protein product [Schistocephalus solidus]|uniref:DUF913 domain-containing protein n=1 Tax=Schistocephalus solidus TaxID=70667 RepID=A0A183TRK2_SCHSO|nr:unnamed protein product [Schistocephalus solidus]